MYNLIIRVKNFAYMYLVCVTWFVHPPSVMDGIMKHTCI